MKVEGPKGPESTKKSSGAKKTSSADAARFHDLMAAAGAEKSSGAVAAQSVNHIDALLAVQGAEDPTERASRGRMRGRADNLLAALDNIRGALLGGTLTLGDVINVADTVASHREKISDPQLTAVLDEIDLRAQIEIAKARKALDNAI